MCEPAVGVLRGKVHIRAHGSADKIITMVTTGCGSSLGTLGESHTDTNSPKDAHINTVKANIHTQTFTHCYVTRVHNVIQQNQTHADEIPRGGRNISSTYIGILYLCPHPNRKQEDINIKDVIT